MEQSKMALKEQKMKMKAVGVVVVHLLALEHDVALDALESLAFQKAFWGDLEA